MDGRNMKRPAGITALSIFSGFGTIASLLSFISLLFPNSFLEPMWRLNPRGHSGLAAMGVAGILLMMAVSIGCALSAYGLWNGRRWGYWLAITGLTINLIGDAINAISGIEPRAAIGLPIVGAILVYLATAKVRSFFHDS
jgi:hypothetical protein